MTSIPTFSTHYTYVLRGLTWVFDHYTSVFDLFAGCARARVTSVFDIYSVVFGKNYTSVFDHDHDHELPSEHYTNYQFFIAAPYSSVFDHHTPVFGTHYTWIFDPVYIRF